ncbi:hypothetical protein BDK61_2675 [Haloarcula quadrata]|uniref:Uncharacterized protein n=1 Tax=Haloarcula quadrata TaxID=182779 RepID=A0A495R7T4_9EURY|nr:hypothetical protein [Haloarcula quadrata]RKS83332.1 hypothetical protein BDK61_2675 [Haloarcula quadrata]
MDRQSRIWGDSGTEPAAGEETYAGGEKPIAEHDNWAMWAITKDIDTLASIVGTLEGVSSVTELRYETLADRPAAGTPGRVSFAYDEQIVAVDDGNQWIDLGVKSHDDLADIASDDHHARYTDAEAQSAVVGSVDAASLTGSSGSSGQVLETDGDALSWSDISTRTDEEIEDVVASLVQAGDKLSWTYDGQNGTLTVDTSALNDEEVEDKVSTLVNAGTGVSVTYDDQNGALTVEVPEGAISSTELNFDPATSGGVDAVDTALSDHKGDETNPHNVNDDQTGAADARTDLRFALYPEEVDASTRDTYYQNFSKFANSAAMTSIAASSVVMDEVSESNTAMDAASASDTAMDAVSTSPTAMDAVSTSIMARTAILHSSHVRGSVWTETIGAEKLWEAGEPTPPASYLGGEDIDAEMIQDRSESAYQLRVELYNSTSGGLYTYDLAIDWDEASTLRIYTAADNISASGYMTVQIGGSEVFSTNSNHGWTERSIDASGYSGEQDLQMGFWLDSATGITRTTEFAEIQLE